MCFGVLVLNSCMYIGTIINYEKFKFNFARTFHESSMYYYNCKLYILICKKNII